MHHHKSKKSNESNLKTASGWAIELRRDRRTIAAKLKGTTPEGTRDGFPVYSLGAVLKALEPPPGESATLRDAKLKEEIRKLKLYNDKRDELLVEKAKVRESINAFNVRIDGILTDMEREWPALMAGLEIAQIRILMARKTDEARAQVSQAYGVWTC